MFELFYLGVLVLCIILGVALEVSGVGELGNCCFSSFAVKFASFFVEKTLVVRGSVCFLSIWGKNFLSLPFLVILVKRKWASF